jgi:hypothetical protein
MDACMYKKELGCGSLIYLILMNKKKKKIKKIGCVIIITKFHDIERTSLKQYEEEELE